MPFLAELNVEENSIQVEKKKQKQRSRPFSSNLIKELQDILLLFAEKNY